ncbi:hypothetical protein [Sphingobacterium sp. BIGb0116]|uniref:hypothetical protein n=1 Tax=Sphingobacterium sp. BIGb0116 TaxID=2940619 RepID=UPI0021697EF8|nr:hypothetical protein [Sphingobacterium sp. BIGb0116]MCS4165290.1 hypothetical protein [Sphingobacterium sp. BIGb0116]
MKAYFQNSSKLNIKFSILFWQLFFGTLPFTLIVSPLAFTGQRPANFNGEHLIGISGALISLITHPIVVFVGTIILWTILLIGRIIIEFIFKNSMK